MRYVDEATPWAVKALAEYRRTVIDNPWIGGRGVVPHPKQQQFLMLSDVRELFFGGAGGGGKSYSLWLGALQYVDVPGYAAMIFRRTYPDLSKPGAIMDRSKQYLAGTDASWNEKDKRWTFPSGATITFAHMQYENNRYQYAGGEYQFLAFDELSHFTELQYTFLFSRLRKTKGTGLDHVPLRMRSASNPGGPGHEFCKKRFIDPETRKKDAIFIPSAIKDNPTLDIEEYRASLANVDPVTRAQIEDGDWNAVEGGRFKKDWFPRYRWLGSMIMTPSGELFDPFKRQRFLVIDTAASSKQSADYTVIGVWCLSPRAELVCLAVYRFQAEIPEVLSSIKAAVRKWKPDWVGIECVGGHSGKGVADTLRRCDDPPMTIKALSPKGQDKLVRAMPAIILASDHRILLPENDPSFPADDVLGELSRFTGQEGAGNDDIVDMFAYASSQFHYLSPKGTAPPAGVGGLSASHGQASPAVEHGPVVPGAPKPATAPRMGVGGIRRGPSIGVGGIR